MKKHIFFTSFLCLFISVLINAQELPPIEVYSPEIYGGSTQNWGISQSKEKYIYVANNKGLLEFNGATWELYPSPNETIIRSVNVIDDLIYTGSYREFGFWKRNDLGSLVYTSLSKKIGISFLEDEEFWNIIALDDWILFQSLKRIYIYNKKDGSYSIIDSDTTIYKMFKVHESIYFQKAKDGIYKIENGEPKRVSNDSVIINNVLVNIFNFNNNLLIETEDNGFYILENNTLIKWDIPANEALSKVSVYRSIQLKDNSFVLGTISDGIIHLTVNGEIDYQINHNNSFGLSNNTVQSIFEDVENNIWLGLNNGINCVNLKSHFSIYNDDKGEIGTTYASAVFNNKLYLGTNQGLFYKPLNSDQEFTFIEGTQGQTWCLFEYDNTLFCGHNAGTFVVNEDAVEKISDIQGTWNIIAIPNQENKLLQGNYDGLYVLEKNMGSWRFKNKINGFDMSSKFFEIYDNNQVFVSHEYKGVFKVHINETFTDAQKVVKDSFLEKGVNSSLIKYNKDILYAHKDGVFKYNYLNDTFAKDSVLSKLYDKRTFTSGKLVFNKQANKLWAFSESEISYVSPGRLSNIPKVNKIPFSKSLPKGLTGYENITHLIDQKYLLGSSTGYVVIDLDRINDKSHTISINSVTKSDKDSNQKIVNKLIAGNFKNDNSNIEFTFSVAEFDKYLDTQYQYKLEGMDAPWSEWTSNASVVYKNLSHGDYVFQVRAKVGNTLTNNVASYGFKIERPWYLSNQMIATYLFSILLFSLFMHNVYKRYYTIQREKLLQKTKVELELKELENKQQLMKFNNDKLRQDIENKNRELGISTMSLIKKNEFLNNIKSELKNLSGDKSLKSVIRIIDKNLNNSDDWNLFEEAFNNADKDFLKKIKSEHPLLTSNDLRLCAYLRLNLSSKEIAPLLNISARSVEVKRYRLRKKMNLQHESSLSDYILEI